MAAGNRAKPSRVFSFVLSVLAFWVFCSEVQAFWIVNRYRDRFTDVETVSTFNIQQGYKIEISCTNTRELKFSLSYYHEKMSFPAVGDIEVLVRVDKNEVMKFAGQSGRSGVVSFVVPAAQMRLRLLEQMKRGGEIAFRFPPELSRIDWIIKLNDSHLGIGAVAKQCNGE